MSRYDEAKEIYAALGVDTDEAIKKLCAMSISMHCWQGDDVAGFETADSKLTGGGIMSRETIRAERETFRRCGPTSTKPFP